MPEKIFSGLNFVISRTENVKQLSSLIRKGGGHISRQLDENVDYFIQSYNIEDDDRLEEANSFSVQVVPVLFIKDCIRKHCLLDLKDHALGLFTWSIVPTPEKRTAFLRSFVPPLQEWRETEEQPQCFDEFAKMENRIIPEPEANILFILPLYRFKIVSNVQPPMKKAKIITHSFDTFILNISEHLNIFFGLPVTCLPKQRVHYDHASNKYRFCLKNGGNKYVTRAKRSTEALEAMDLIDILIENIPKSGVCLIVVTDCRIYEVGEQSAELYGRATGDGGCVISTYQQPDIQRFNSKETEKFLLCVASHELMHCFGLDHCAYFGCVMNACSDASQGEKCNPPLTLCPICLRKLHMALGFDVTARYYKLLDRYTKGLYDREISTISTLLKLI